MQLLPLFPASHTALPFASVHAPLQSLSETNGSPVIMDSAPNLHQKITSPSYVMLHRLRFAIRPRTKAEMSHFLSKNNGSLAAFVFRFFCGFPRRKKKNVNASPPTPSPLPFLKRKKFNEKKDGGTSITNLGVEATSSARIAANKQGVTRSKRWRSPPE